MDRWTPPGRTHLPEVTSGRSIGPGVASVLCATVRTVAPCAVSSVKNRWYRPL
jgi:hypothetical protein